MNRVGKITDQKSEKRFDILKTASMAFDAGDKYQIDTIGKAYILALASRMIYWCGLNTLNKDKRRFYEDACTLIQERVSPEVINYAINYCTDEREGILISALASNATRFLITHATKRRRSIFDYVKLLANRQYGQKSRQAARKIILHKIVNLVKRAHLD